MTRPNSTNKETNNNYEPANATGAAVAGTGDDPVHWSRRQPKIGIKGRNKKYGQSFDVDAFLKRRKREQAKKAMK